MTLDDMQALLVLFQSSLTSHPWVCTAAYLAVFTAITALCLPGAGVLLLLSGATFGLAWGSVLGTLASSAGATLTLLMVRHGFRARLERRFGAQLQNLHPGLLRESSLVLLSLRLLPVVPFAVVNIVSGMTRLRATTFFWVSAVGMLPGTAVYVYAGQTLAQVHSLEALLNPEMALAMGLLALLPLATIALRSKFARIQEQSGGPSF
jgi:uncharacterized membrane protein YdjX (TVP38/TMEM64 family)